MDENFKRQILKLLDQHRTMRIATLRPDGWPQVTTVGYANEGFAIYFLCGPDSQKAVNLARDDRVSLAIDDDTPQVMEITGLSMAARARVVDDPAEAEKAMRLVRMVSRTEIVAGTDARAQGCAHLQADAHGDLAARLFEGIRPHRSRHLLMPRGFLAGGTGYHFRPASSAPLHSAGSGCMKARPI